MDNTNEKTVIEQFTTSGNYDHKHVNNLCSKVVPQTLLDSVEQGCSIETLENLAKDFPICKYKTQITIHGLFEEPKSSRVGCYKNLVRNQNKSLGVRWSAVDVAKKCRLYRTLSVIDEGWHTHHDSQCHYAYQLHTCVSREDALATYKELKAFAEGVDKSLFVGDIFASAYSIFGAYYVELRFSVLCYYDKNYDALLDSVTNTTPDERATKIEQYEREQAARQARYDAECAERAKAAAESRARAKAVADEWMAKNPLPESFVECHDYTLQVGDIYWSGRVCGLNTDTPRYDYLVVSKAFGRLIVTACDECGNKRGKGAEPTKTTLAKVRVKRATTPDKAKQTTAKAKRTDKEPDQTATAKIEVVDYSERAWAVVGTTKGMTTLIKRFADMGGKFNPRLSCGAGWVFSKKRYCKDELLRAARG